MTTSKGRKIAVVGASGNLGSHIVDALLSKTIHTVTAISRDSSSSSGKSFPDGVIVKRGDYDNQDFLLSALRGQDVVILVPMIMVLDSQIPFINAAAKAGVPWVIPCEFASDNKHEKLNQELDLMTRKNKYREQIDQLGVSSWIGVVNGPWFDWSFKMTYWGTTKNYWGLDFPAKKAIQFDNGNVKMNTTTVAKTAQGVAALLSVSDQRLADFKKEFVYFSSFHITQREILQSVLRATGDKESDWTIESVSAEAEAEEAKEAIKNGNPMKNVELLWATLARESYGGDYQSKVKLDQELGLEQEDLDSVVKKLVGV